MKIKIHDREIELKYTLRAVLLYENIQNKSFAPETTTDVLVFMYCIILGSDKELHLDFNEFLDVIDDYPQMIVDFSNWIVAETTKNSTLTPEEDENKKKVTKGR